MRILMVTHGFPPRELGGAEIYSYSLTKALVSKGVEVIVFSRTVDLSREDYTVFEDFTDGIRVFRIVNNFNDLYTFFNGFINERVAGFFLKLLKEFNPHLVHFQHLFSLSGNLPYLARYNGVPSVLTLHDYWYVCPKVNLFRADYTVCPGPEGGFACATCPEPSAPSVSSAIPIAAYLDRYPFLKRYLKRFIPERVKNFLKRRLYRHQPKSAENTVQPPVADPLRVMEFFFRLEYLKSQLALCSCLISPSRYLKKRYEVLGYQNIRYIPLGIEKIPPGPEKAEGDEVVFGFVGNITATKGFSLLVNELNLLGDVEGIRLEVHGQIYDPVFYEHCINLLGEAIKKRLIYKGKFDRNPETLARIYHGLDAVIFPSLCEENAPLVVREAISAGTPVIASNRGGTSEVVCHGVNGLLFDPAVSGDLAEKLRIFCSDKNLRKKLKQGARKTNIVDVQDHAASLLKIYEEVLRSYRDDEEGHPG